MIFRLMSKKQLTIWIVLAALVAGSFGYSLVNSVDFKKVGNDGKIHLTLAHWDNGGSTETDLVKVVCQKFMKKYPQYSIKE